MAIATWACLFVFLLFLWMFRKYQKKGRLPPGPKGSFLFGNALQLDMKRFAIQLGEIGKEFEEAYTIRILNDRLVVLNSHDMITEVMTSPRYARIVSGRPKAFIGEYVIRKDEIIQTYSEEWVALRRLVFRGLKTYGTHIAEVERLVQEELKHLVSRIEKDAGRSVDPCDYVSGYVLSIIAMLLTNRKLQHDDPHMSIYSQIVTDGHGLCHPVVDTVAMNFPWLRHIPLWFGKDYKRLTKNMKHLEKEVQSRRKMIENRKPCFLDFMLEEERKGNVDEETIVCVFVDLLITGTSTSRSSLNSLLLLLASRPDLQRNIQQEIDQVIGMSRLPRAEDKQRMPYTEAVLWELFRLYPAAPFTSPHCTMEDVQIRDYFLPKDTAILYNIWNVLHDDKFWKDPYKFDPGRFLDENGDLIPPEHANRQRMIAFGVGKRLCTGEVLARLRIFMACVTILQSYNLVPDPESPLPDTDPRTFDVHFIIVAPNFRVVFQPRTDN